MHTIKLNIQDSVFDKVIYFLKNLPKNEVMIVDEEVINEVLESYKKDDNIKAFSNHTANLISEWKDDSEDEVWK